MSQVEGAKLPEPPPKASPIEIRAVVTDFDMPFMQLVLFLVKLALASIPAALMLLVIFGTLAAVLGIFGAIFK